MTMLCAVHTMRWYLKKVRFNEIHKYEKLKEVEDVNMLENLQKTLQNFKINRLLGQEGGG